MKKLLFAMAVGAGLAWVFDPDSGSRRRDRLRKTLEDKRLATGARSATPPAPEPLIPEFSAAANAQ